MEVIAAGTTVWTEEAGSGEERVLLLHGWGCSTKLMKPVADRLADRCRVLSVDFPGFGKSGRPPEPWGIPEYAACLNEVLQKLDFTPCDVIAHSFGCRVAVWLSAENPALFRRLVLTGAAGIRPPQTEESKKRSEEYKRLKARYEKLKGLKILGSLPDRLEDRLREKYGSADYNALDEEMRRTFVKVVNQDLTDCLPKICQSTLLIFGENDTETPVWMGQKMESLIPDAGLVILPGGSHFAYLEQPNRFIPIIRNFLLGE